MSSGVVTEREAVAEVSIVEEGFNYAVLGPLEVQFAGAPVSVGGPRHRALLAALLVRPNSVVSAGHLVETLWEDPPERAIELLYGRIAEVRGIMRAAAGRAISDLETHHGGYLLRVADGALDAQRFERLVERGWRVARAGDHRGAAELQRQALSLWRGPALTEVAGRPEAEAEIARLQELRLRAVEARIDADLAEGRHGELIAELVALVAEHPLNERLWGQLMLARYRCGLVGEALATFETARRELVEQLGTEPGPGLQRLHRQMLRLDLELTPDVPVPVAVLPRPLATFIGRDGELAALRRLLRAQRLVTVTGVGGAGKSRLALQAGADVGAVWLVELAALTQPSSLADAVGDALGVAPQGTRSRMDVIVEHLRDVDGLLILDNCEHLLDVVAGLIERILAGCPGLRVLATSRERIGVTGEALLPLPGLGVPEEGVATAVLAGRSPAVRLFVDRATATDPRFTLTDRNAAVVAKICRELDGLPLAIELAAARANAFTVDELAARLGDRFGLLSRGSRTAEPRHRTLHAVVDWSYRLLDDDERFLFARLSVFGGRFELAWAEELAADEYPPATTAGIVAALVDKSLLSQESGRYRMLETLRAYGIERLAERGDLDRVRDRYAALVVAIADDPQQFGGDGTAAQFVGATMEQFRTAMEWSADRGDAQIAQRIAAALTLHGHEPGQHVAGRRWLQLTLPGGDVSPVLRARALSGLTLLAAHQGDLDAATAAGEQAAALFQEAGDMDRYGIVLRRLAFAEIFSGSLRRADALLIRAQQATASPNPGVRAAVLAECALMALLLADWDRAVRLSDEVHEILRDADDPKLLIYTTLIRAEAVRNLSGPAAGAEWLCAALRSIDGTGWLWNPALGLQLASRFFHELGLPPQEIVALSAVHEMVRRTGGALHRWAERHNRKRLTELRKTVPSERFEALWQQGRTRPVMDLIDEVHRQLCTGSSLAPSERLQHPPRPASPAPPP